MDYTANRLLAYPATSAVRAGLSIFCRFCFIDVFSFNMKIVQKYSIMRACEYKFNFYGILK